MSGKAFVDTNVFVYLFDHRDPAKQRSAQELLTAAGAENGIVISTQVLQETYVALTRKISVAPDKALEAVRMMTAYQVISTDAALVLKGAHRSIKNQLSLWDALIVEAALEARCEVLYSEDLSNGQAFDAMTVRNPFDKADVAPR